MIRHHKLKDRLLGGIAALALSAAPVLATDGADVSAQHDAAAVAHETAARHHRAAAQHHRLSEHAVAKAHAMEAEQASANAHERTKSATTASEQVKHQTSLLSTL
jgi:hypothetical protein